MNTGDWVLIDGVIEGQIISLHKNNALVDIGGIWERYKIDRIKFIEDMKNKILLTDRVKIDFDDWFLHYVYGKFSYFPSFYELPLMSQWGFYTEFFAINDIKCNVNVKDAGVKYYESNVNGYLGAWCTFEEAVTEAVKRANHVMNTREL